MNDGLPVVAAPDTSAGAGDGLALARLLAALMGRELFVTRVLDDGVSTVDADIALLVLGGAAGAAIDQAPCAVAVAPPVFRDAPVLAPADIGCAYDGTVASVDALLSATDLAWAIGAPLQVLTVAAADDTGRLFADARALIREAAGDAVFVECVALEGDPARALLRRCQGHVGLLVMGSRGLAPIRRAMLGSVSARVVRDATCPVVIVPRRG